MHISLDSINDRKLYSADKSRSTLHQINSNSYATSSGNKHMKMMMSPSSIKQESYLSDKKEATMKRIVSQAYRQTLENNNSSAFRQISHQNQQDTGYKVSQFSQDSREQINETFIYHLNEIFAKSALEQIGLITTEDFQNLLQHAGLLEDDITQSWQELWAILMLCSTTQHDHAEDEVSQQEKVTPSLLSNVMMFLTNPQMSVSEVQKKIYYIFQQAFDENTSHLKEHNEHLDFSNVLDQLNMHLETTVYRLFSYIYDKSHQIINKQSSSNNQSNLRKEDFSKSSSSMKQQLQQQEEYHQELQYKQEQKSQQQTNKQQQQLNNIDSHGNSQTIRRYELLFQHAQLLNKKRDTFAVLKEKEELDKCTFHPILKTSLQPNLAASSKLKEYQDQEVYSRLYGNALDVKAKLAMEHNKKELKLEEEYQQFSFHPQINKHGSYSNKQKYVSSCVPGAKNVLDRLSKARKLKEEKDQFWNKQEDIYRNQTPKQEPTKVEAFSFVSRKDPLKKEPIMYLDVNVSAGRKGRIALYQGDESKKVASDFARIYHLPTEAVKELEERINQATYIYYSQLL